MNITNRTTHAVQQGTGPWLRLREGYDTASEAPAALGVSKYVQRHELMRQKHTGVAAEHSLATLGKFAAGHAAEDAARPLAEAIVEGDLFPVTMTAIVDGLPLLASLDGLTLDGDTAWETKLWNEELAAAVRAARAGTGSLPEHYTVQMDQELLVSGASRCLFTCTDGTPDRLEWCWYEPGPERFAALVAGWRQFRADLAAYVLPDPAPEPARAEPMESLPAVSVRLDGALSVVGNLPTFAVALREFVAKIPQRPSTDTEFATCDAACKALKKAEEALDAAEAGALASITDVDAMRRAVADCRKLARDTRLAAEKMVERRKLEIKEQAVMAARRALDDHIAALNAEIAPMRLQPMSTEFGGAIKGLRSFDSMQGALDAKLAEAKIAADNQARGIRANVAAFNALALADDFGFLFADLHELVHKAADDFAAVVRLRIAAHKEAEAEKERKRQAAEAERIAAAEARARADEAARIAAQQAEDARVAALARQREEAAAAESARVAAAALAQAQAPAPAPVASTPQQAAAEPVAPVPAPASRPPRTDEPATLKLGDICARLGVTVTAAFLGDTLHIRPARTDGRAALFTEGQYQTICRQLISHVGAMAELYAVEEVA